MRFLWSLNTNMSNFNKCLRIQWIKFLSEFYVYCLLFIDLEANLEFLLLVDIAKVMIFTTTCRYKDESFLILVFFFCRVFEKSLQYVKRFSRYKNPDAVRQVREYPCLDFMGWWEGWVEHIHLMLNSFWTCSLQLPFCS